MFQKNSGIQREHAGIRLCDPFLLVPTSIQPTKKSRLHRFHLLQGRSPEGANDLLQRVLGRFGIDAPSRASGNKKMGVALGFPLNTPEKRKNDLPLFRPSRAGIHLSWGTLGGHHLRERPACSNQANSVRHMGVSQNGGPKILDGLKRRPSGNHLPGEIGPQY